MRLSHQVGDVTVRRKAEKRNAWEFNDIVYDEEAQLNMLRSPAVSSVSRYCNARLVVAMHRLWFLSIS